VLIIICKYLVQVTLDKYSISYQRGVAAHPLQGGSRMKRDAYEDLVVEISKQLAEKILLEEGDLTAKAKPIDCRPALSRYGCWRSWGWPSRKNLIDQHSLDRIGLESSTYL
jgi:hypothetical protein